VDEFALIDALLKPIAGSRDDVVLGIGDDGAVVRPPPGEELVVVADTLVAGVHFPPELSAADIGYRAVAVNLSDIAAMGAEPRWATLALTLPHNDERWLRAFARGLQDALSPAQVALIGGDTTRGPLTITVQVIGSLPSGTALTRHGARPGDSIYVSGTLGDAAAGLGLLQRGGVPTESTATLLARFARPDARIALGQALRGIATSCIDISDGLMADLGHIAARSACGARIEAALIPMSAAYRSMVNEQEQGRLAATGGDDYELCFTLPPGTASSALRDLQRLTPIQRIGHMTAVAGEVLLVDPTGLPVEVTTFGYRHF
jgi:thiamine-monophosphate kinase